MLRIRLRRVGAKKQPSYRIVVAEKTAPRDGRFVEVVGFYNPRTDPETVNIKEDRVLYWMSNGAQPSDAVARIFKTHGTMDRFARLRAGESLSDLVAEANAAAAATVVEEAPEVIETPEATEAVEEPEVVEADAATAESVVDLDAVEEQES